ncbi:MAG: DUF4149 domain-containing protein [Pseudomonadota bacterium]
MKFLARLPAIVAALWWGSLSTLGFFVVPMLFVHLQPAALAGNLAAKLFTGQTWISVACGMLLLVVSRPRFEDGDADDAVPRSRLDPTSLALVIAGLLLALLVEFAVTPHIVARDNLKLWHGVGSGMYLAQWLCAGAVFWRSLGRLLGPATRA